MSRHEGVSGFLLARLYGNPQKVLRDRYLTVPNLITGMGILGVGLYVCLFLSARSLWLIPLVHIGILLTDAFDGAVADALDQHSRVGRFIDPLRDRMHALALIANLALFESDIWAGVVIIAIAEGWVAWLGYRKEIRGVHLIGKCRALVYWLSGLIALIQIYWLGITFVPIALLFGAMVGASVIASIVYNHIARANRSLA